MATVQERLQLNRTPLDKWSTREQLALASAVLSSGDQNWMSVSRALKVLCGNSKDTLHPRPGDWFSQKNCAVQYGHLLEDVETPKRKKRTSESSLSSSPPVEAPTEAIVRRLTEERMQEIKLEIRKQQEEYASIVAEIKALQSGRLEDVEILQMWSDIEKEQEMLRIDEMKMENQLREREMRKQEMQRNWRTSSGGAVPSNSSSSSSLKSSTDTTAVDMDVEEIIGSTKTVTSNTGHSMQMQAGTSPLLTSLLKSPTASNSPSSIGAASVSARTSAPTITTLLTSGSIPNPNQPALIPAGDSAIQLLTRPISGPPLDSSITSGSNQLSLLSPSQSAPTLSMLLEKNKSAPSALSTEIKTFDSNVNTKTETDTVSANDSNNESIPMDIEEDMPATTNVTQDADDIDDTDPNEEQQLMEVFKNIGNIDELDIDVSDVIDEEVDFLKGVDEEETALEEAVEDLEEKLVEASVELVETIKQDAQSSLPPTVNIDDIKQESNIQNPENATEANVPAKTELTSSDDSNDNIPLAAVASLESSKDRLNESSNESSFLKEQVESAFPKNEPAEQREGIEGDSTKLEIKQEMLDEHEQPANENAGKSNDNPAGDDKNEDDHTNSDGNKQGDVFVVPAMEDSNKASGTIKTECEDDTQSNSEGQDHNKMRSDVDDMNGESNHPPEQSEGSADTSMIQPQNDLQNIETTMDTSSSLSMLQPPPAISVADTDENSSSTDISIQTRKDEKSSSSSSKRQSSHYQRKSPHDAKTDDEMPNPSTQMAVPNNSGGGGGSLTPRPTALRKLRDRDRSESPMIDDDATTQSDHSTTTTNQRSRRRYSSTPVIDSIPNSPASSDRDESRDLRTYKKSLLSIYNVLQNSKHAATIQRILNDENTPYKLEEICLKPMDFASIKNNIESGVIRSAYELQRDVLLMCQNALFVTKTNSATAKAVLAFQQECQNIREFMPNFLDSHGGKLDRNVRDTKSSGSTSSSTGGGSTSKGRSGSRKSLRLS
ncbi:bromodomain-containing protein 8 [Musca vetustissima]|uniref:bromodomain-containing protein 8 n=1 Tax=Musca vetustissima TaxID=27455 RepID=UPI002AB76DE4|nr:bromodomain-containing protein 8 [Musca vetustissima]